MKTIRQISKAVWAELPRPDDTFFQSIGRRAVNFYAVSMLLVLVEALLYFGFVILWQHLPTSLQHIPARIDVVTVQSCAVDLRCEPNSLWQQFKFVHEDTFEDTSHQLIVDGSGRSDCKISLCLPTAPEQAGKPVIFDIAASLLDIDFNPPSAPCPYGWNGSALESPYPIEVLSEVGRASKVWIRSPPVPTRAAATHNHFNVTLSSGVVMISAEASAFGEYHTRVGFGPVLVVPADGADATGLSASVDVLGNAFCVQDEAATLTATEVPNASRPVPSWNWIRQSGIEDADGQNSAPELTTSELQHINMHTNNNSNTSSASTAAPITTPESRQEWYNETRVNVTIGNGDGARVTGFASSFYVIDPAASPHSRIVGETLETRRPQIDLAAVEALRGTAAWAAGSPLPDYTQVVEVVSPGLGSIFLNCNRRVLLEFSPALIGLLTGFALIPQHRRLLTPLSHYRCNATFSDLFPGDSLLGNLERSDEHSAAELQHLTADFLSNDVLADVWARINAAAGGFTGFRTPAIVRSRHFEALDTFEIEDSRVKRVPVKQRPIDILLLNLTVLVALTVIVGLVAMIIAHRQTIFDALMIREDRQRTRVAFGTPQESPYILYLSTLYVHQLAAFNLCRQLEPYVRYGCHLSKFLLRFFVEDRSGCTEYAVSDIIESFEDDRRARFLVVADPESGDLEDSATSVCASTEDRIVDVAIGVAPASTSLGSGDTIGGEQYLVTGKPMDATIVNTIALRSGQPLEMINEEVQMQGIKIIRQTHFMLTGAALRCEFGEPLLSVVRLRKVYATLDSLIWSAPLFGLCLYPMRRGTKQDVALPVAWVIFQLTLCSLLLRLPAVFVLFVVTMFESTNRLYTPSTDGVHLGDFGSVLFPGRRGLTPFSFAAWNAFAILFSTFVSLTWVESLTVLAFRRFSPISRVRFEFVRAIVSSIAGLLVGCFVLLTVGYIVVVLLWWVLGAIIAPTAMLANATAAIATVAGVVGAYSTLQNNRKALVNKLKASALDELEDLFRSASGTVGASSEDDSLGDALGPAFSAGNLLGAVSGDAHAVAELAPALGIPPLCVDAVVAGAKKDLAMLKNVVHDVLELFGAEQLHMDGLVALVVQKLLDVPTSATDLVRAASEFLRKLPIDQSFAPLLNRSEPLVASLVDAVVLHDGVLDAGVLLGAVTRVLMETVRPLAAHYGVPAESLESLRHFGNASSQQDFPVASGALWEAVKHIDIDAFAAALPGQNDDGSGTEMVPLFAAVRRMAEAQLCPKAAVDVRSAAMELLSSVESFMSTVSDDEPDASPVHSVFEPLRDMMDTVDVSALQSDINSAFAGLGVTMQLLVSAANSRPSEWAAVAAVLRFAFTDASVVESNDATDLLRPLINNGVMDVQQATCVRPTHVFEMAVDLFDNVGRAKRHKQREKMAKKRNKKRTSKRAAEEVARWQERDAWETELALLVGFSWCTYAELLGIFDGSQELDATKATILSAAESVIDRANIRTGLTIVDLLFRLASVLRSASGCASVDDPLRIAQGPLLLALAGSWDPIRILLPLGIFVPPQVGRPDCTPAYRAIESHLNSARSLVVPSFASSDQPRAPALVRLAELARNTFEYDGKPKPFVDSYRYQLLCPFAVDPPSMYNDILEDRAAYSPECYVAALTLPLVRRLVTQRLTPYKAWYRSRVTAAVVAIQKAAMLPTTASATEELLIAVLSEIWTAGKQSDRATLTQRAKDVAMTPAQLGYLMDPAALVAASPIAEAIVAAALFVPQTGEETLRRLRSRREYREGSTSSSFRELVKDVEERVVACREESSASVTVSAGVLKRNYRARLEAIRTHMAPRVYRVAKALLVLVDAEQLHVDDTASDSDDEFDVVGLQSPCVSDADSDSEDEADPLSGSDVTNAVMTLTDHLSDLKISPLLLEASVTWIRTAFGKRVSLLNARGEQSFPELARVPWREFAVDRLVCRAALQEDWEALTSVATYLATVLRTIEPPGCRGQMDRVADFFACSHADIVAGHHMHNPPSHFENPMLALREEFDAAIGTADSQNTTGPDTSANVAVGVASSPLDDVQQSLLSPPDFANGTGEYHEMSEVPDSRSSSVLDKEWTQCSMFDRSRCEPDSVAVGLVATILRSNFTGARIHLVRAFSRLLFSVGASAEHASGLADLLLALCRAIMHKSSRPGPQDVTTNALGIARAVVSVTLCSSKNDEVSRVGQWASDFLSVCSDLLHGKCPASSRVGALLGSALPSDDTDDVHALLRRIVETTVRVLSCEELDERKGDVIQANMRLCVALACKQSSVEREAEEAACRVAVTVMTRLRTESDAKAKLAAALRLLVDECVTGLTATTHGESGESHHEAPVETAHVVAKTAGNVMPSEFVPIMRKLMPIVLFLSGDVSKLPAFLDTCGITVEPQSAQAAAQALLVLRSFASDKPMRNAAIEGTKKQFIDGFVDFIFNEFDHEGRGSIDFNALSAILRRLHLQLSTSQQKALFERVDKDRSGMVDKREFRAVLAEVQASFVDQAMDLLNLSHGRIIAAVVYLGFFTVVFLAFILLGISAFTDGSEFTTVITGALPVLTRGLKGLASSSSLEQLIQLGETAIALVFEHARSRGM